jgi:hypothetical protein
MWRSLFSPVSVHAPRRSVSLHPSAEIPGASRRTSPTVQQTFRRLQQWSSLNPVAMFTVRLIFGAAVAVGTILALFAWSKAAL